MLESFFIQGDLPLNAEKGTYQVSLLFLSYLVGCFSSYTALSMAQYMTDAETPREKTLFRLGSAFAMGGGLWSAHFISLLSYRTNMAVEYDFRLILPALLVALCVTYYGSGIIIRDRLSLRQLLTSGILMGLALCSMHLMSAAAMRVDAELRYLPGAAFLLVVIVITVIVAALWMAFILIRRGGKYHYLLRVALALVIGAFILIGDYYNIEAMVIIPHADSHHELTQNFETLALSISVVTSIILSIALAVGIYRRLRIESRLQGSEAHLHEMIRALAASRQYLQSMIDHIPDPVFMKDRQHHIIGGNKAFWSLMDGPPEKFIGKNEYDLFPKEDVDRFHAMDDEVFNSSKVTVNEEIFIDARGKRHVLSTKRAPFLNEKGEQFLVAVSRDITPLKETESQLLKYTRDLENSNRELDDFAYIVSHDLKEPLRGLQSFSRFLLEDYEDKLDEEGKRKLHTISGLTLRLETLLDTLLHYSRLGRTDLSFRATDLDAAVRNIIDIFSINLKEKNATVEILQKLPTVVCDHARITEVFRNLISNAIKYTDHGENKIEIGYITDHQRKPGETVFYVRDHGIGIPQKHLETIFKIFKRLHPKEAYNGGTGSGLAIVKRVITQHGGEVWAESTEGQGTTFFFTLPQQN